MATLNEMIAQGAQFYTPDPTAQYNKLAQMQKYQQENELAKMQMEEYGRARQESNALRQFLPGLNESNRSQLLGFGAPGQGVYKTLAEGGKEQRLSEQAVSQTALHKSNILKNAVEQTRNAIAGIDPTDVESYAALRTGVLTQYPELTPYMPAAWDANIKQRLITTAASVLEGQKPNIAPINPKDYTPESLQAYRNSNNPASLVAVAPKAANVYAPIDPSKYTQDSLKAYGLSGQVSDLVPVAAKAANVFAPLNPKDYTPDSLRAFVASQNPADLVAAPSKATNVYAPINPKDYTPESLKAYGLSGEVSDLVPVAAKAEKPTSLINQIDPSKFTPSSVAAFSTAGGDYSLLVPVAKTDKADRTIGNVNPSDFTPKSLDKYYMSGNYGDLVRVAKSGGGEGGGAAKAPSGFRFTPTGDLEAIPGGPAAGKPLTDLQKQGLKKDFAADTSKIKSAVDTADELEKLTDELVGNPDKKIKPHPGLGGITGYAGLLPSFAESPVTSGNAAKAEQKLDTFKGKIKTLGRSLASLDGKLGNMAVQEWQMVSDSVQAIKPTAGNLDEQMRDVIRQARLLAKNLQDKFDLTYENTTPAAAPGRPDPLGIR